MTRKQANMVFGGILAVIVMQCICTVAILRGQEETRNATTAGSPERAQREAKSYEAQVTAGDILAMQPLGAAKLKLSADDLWIDANGNLVRSGKEHWTTSQK